MEPITIDSKYEDKIDTLVLDFGKNSKSIFDIDYIEVIPTDETPSF